MFIKTFVILADLLIFFSLILIEFVTVLGFVAWPFATVWVLFIY